MRTKEFQDLLDQSNVKLDSYQFQVASELYNDSSWKIEEIIKLFSRDHLIESKINPKIRRS